MAQVIDICGTPFVVATRIPMALPSGKVAEIPVLTPMGGDIDEMEAPVRTVHHYTSEVHTYDTEVHFDHTTYVPGKYPGQGMITHSGPYTIEERYMAPRRAKIQARRDNARSARKNKATK
jgi:hypothetical protein